MDGAAAKGRLKIVQWLHHNRKEGGSTAAMDVAAKNGNLQVVKWLHENRTEGCTTKAMDNAKTFEIMRWLHDNRTEGCTSAAMNRAASDGDFDRVLFLYSQYTEGCTEDAFDNTRKMGLYAFMRESSFERPSDNINDWLNVVACIPPSLAVYKWSTDTKQNFATPCLRHLHSHRKLAGLSEKYRKHQ
ncbi:uncharacterized protein PITG_15411 [Phytophthora infestans T30-4]|uniref:Uncharacterized protein n=1 Tax=Phytophthora infestans (strain T30-4) TaxID=403677 RepID=D0NR69_PHYIT|nr:uncharacterized protein PITG_15411 [Phytophthora infestans T30-4]EEY63191.1 conserved hypothetical protein [Phytophthora infestans T30-4]|eukprot:XP_002898368.1 conserved hypothetical protein [Phytophthora infestans T30-4]